MIPKKLKIFIIGLVVLFVMGIIHIKIDTWYPDFTREVKNFDKLELDVVYLDEEDEDISNLVNYELLEQRNLFSKAKGYKQEFEYSKDNLIYNVYIYVEKNTNCISTFYKETYNDIEILYTSSVSNLYSTTAYADMNGYSYMIEVTIDKEEIDDKDLALENTKEIVLDFTHQLIDKYIEK